MQYLLLSYCLCLLCSTVGFIRVVYFVGLGYGASMAAQALAAIILYSPTLKQWPLAQALLLLAYGLRLGGYLLLRDRAPGFRVRETNREPKQRNVSTVAKIGIWSGVATLYVLMALPVFVTLSAAARGMPLASLPYGVALMVIGLGLESVADRQKYRFKAAHPTRFCDTGLYHFVRCPNYLGEMLFWIGLWLSATAAYQGWLEWSLCSLGLATILGIMIGATRRLEGEQATHYGNDGGYATYRTSVPVLLPLLPLYTLRGSGSGRP